MSSTQLSQVVSGYMLHFNSLFFLKRIQARVAMIIVGMNGLTL